jgi:hypothetical protein
MDFLTEFKDSCNSAFSYGIQKVPIEIVEGKPNFTSRKHQIEFKVACIKGYKKAQNKVFEFLKVNQKIQSLSSNQKQYQELVMRKIIDGLVYTIFATQAYYIKKLTLFQKPPNLDFRVLSNTMEKIRELNKESNLKFILYSDLSTLVHIGDFLSIDQRFIPPKIDIGELKSGKVNFILEKELGSFEISEDSLEKIDNSPTIGDKYKRQAKRMMKQKIRTSQVAQLIENDFGFDPSYERYSVLSEKTYYTGDYTAFLNKIMDQAIVDGGSAGTINYCLHFGIGYSDDFKEAKENAEYLVNLAMKKTMYGNFNEIEPIVSEVSSKISDKKTIICGDLFQQNINESCPTPFTLWGLSKEHIFKCVEKKMVILFIFDIVSFMWLARKHDLNLVFSSRSFAEKIVKNLGRKNVTTFDNRLLCIKLKDDLKPLGGGFLSHIIQSLEYPLKIIENYKSEFAQK